MLSTEMRQRVEFICSRIAQGASVELSDITWLQKLASRNPSVNSKLKKARDIAMNGQASQESLDGFMQAMELSDAEDSLSGAQDPVTLAEWFQTKRRWFRGQSSL